MRSKWPRSQDFADRLEALLSLRGWSIRAAAMRAARNDLRGRRSLEAWRQLFRRWSDGLVPPEQDLLEALAILGFAEPRRCCRWALAGPGGEVPAEIRDLAMQPETRDPHRFPEAARGAVDPELALVRALEAVERGEDPAPILRFAVEAIRTARETLRQAKHLGLAGLALALGLGTASNAESAGFQNWRIRPLCQPSENDDDDDEDSEKPDENRPAGEAPKRRGRPRCAAPRVEQAPPRSSITEVDDSTSGPRVPIPEAARGAA